MCWQDLRADILHRGSSSLEGADQDTWNDVMFEGALWRRYMSSLWQVPPGTKPKLQIKA